MFFSISNMSKWVTIQALTSLRVLARLLLELVEGGVELWFDLLLDLSHFDLVVVLNLRDLVLQCVWLLVPFKNLYFVHRHLTEYVLHRLHVLLELVNLNVASLQLLVPCLSYFLHFLLLFYLDIVQGLLRCLLGLVDLVLELEHQFHVFSILVDQCFNQCLTVLNLRFKLLSQPLVVTPHPQYFLLLLCNHPLHFLYVAISNMSCA